MRTALVGTVLLSGTLARAAIIIVPDQYPTIQAAIDASVPGDTIQVRGTYAEALKIKDKSLVIEGLGGRSTIAPGPTATGVAYAKPSSTWSSCFGSSTSSVLASVCRRECMRCTSSKYTLRAAARERLSSPRLYQESEPRRAREHGERSGQRVQRPRQGGLVYLDRHTSWIRGCDASNNGGAGLTVASKGSGVVLSDNQANDNATYGFRTHGILQSEADLINDGNVASGNGVQDFLVE